MTASGDIDRIAALTRYFFQCPPSKHIIIIMIISALLFPIAGNDLFSKTGFFIFLLIPAFLTSALSWRIVQKLGGIFKGKYSYFLSTISMLSIAVLLAVVSLVERFYTFKTWSPLEILFVGLSAVFMLHVLVYAAVGNLSIYRAILPASIYLILSSIILYSFHVVTLRILGRFATLLFVSFFLVWLFIKLTDAPFKRTLGIPTFDLISLAIMEYVDPEQISKNPFKNIGKLSKIPNQAIKFETKKNKYLLTVPWLHPGPVESIGGKMPSELVTSLKKFATNSVFLHTYVDHSLNPIFLEKTISKILSALGNKNTFSQKLSKCTKFLSIKVNGASLLAQKFGNAYFFISSFAPKITEDITPSVGLALLEKFNNKAIFVDAHNSFSPEDEDIESIGFGDERIDNLFLAVDSAKEKLDKETQYPLKVSVVNSEHTFLDYGVKGIRVIAFEISKQKAAFIVLDANNLVPEFRAEIIAKLNSLGFNIVEILTTDTHMGNFVVKIYGQIGRLGKEVLEKEITLLAQEALQKLEKANVSYSFSQIDVKVFGERTFPQLIATAHALIPFAKFLTVSLFIAFLFAAYVILQLPILTNL